MFSKYEMDDFVDAYAMCAAWVEHNDTGYPHDVIEEMIAECEAFVESCFDEREDAFEGWTPEQAGHDFYLTRNGHGTGYWDRGKGEMGDYLTSMAKPYGETDYEHQ